MVSSYCEHSHVAFKNLHVKMIKTVECKPIKNEHHSRCQCYGRCCKYHESDHSDDPDDSDDKVQYSTTTASVTFGKGYVKSIQDPGSLHRWSFVQKKAVLDITMNRLKMSL